ncbi:MAG: hypothetical protein R2788_15030 [Saprospiraceae bacterium]
MRFEKHVVLKLVLCQLLLDSTDTFISQWNLLIDHFFKKIKYRFSQLNHNHPTFSLFAISGKTLLLCPVFQMEGEGNVYHNFNQN